jgi:hypothetical protein
MRVHTPYAYKLARRSTTIGRLLVHTQPPRPNCQCTKRGKRLLGIKPLREIAKYVSPPSPESEARDLNYCIRIVVICKQLTNWFPARPLNTCTSTQHVTITTYMIGGASGERICENDESSHRRYDTLLAATNSLVRWATVFLLLLYPVQRSEAPC